jgi:hypothetical protein
MNLLIEISEILNATGAHKSLMKLGEKMGLNEESQEELANRIESFIEQEMGELLEEQEEPYQTWNEAPYGEDNA